MNGVDPARWAPRHGAGVGGRPEGKDVPGGPEPEPSRRGDEDEDEHQPCFNHRGDSDMTKTELERAVRDGHRAQRLKDAVATKRR
jgi:hypothetical protein